VLIHLAYHVRKSGVLKVHTICMCCAIAIFSKFLVFVFQI